MSEPFLAEVRMVGFDFPPRGWAFCDGQILPINQNQSLYSLLGTTYGGDGRTSFALPDLRGRTPIHVGQGDNGQHHQLGEKSGEETHTLSVNEIPRHEHAWKASSSDGNSSTAAGHMLAREAGGLYRQSPSNLVDMMPATLSSTGGSQPHENMQPYLAVNFCIALQGLFPSRN